MQLLGVLEQKQKVIGSNMSKSFELSKVKQLCRDKLLELTHKHIPEAKTIVTLPSRLGLCIKTFKSVYKKANYIAIERDPEIFQDICSQGVYCVNSDIREYIHSQTLPASHVDMFFMDYYSFLNEGVVGDIQAFIKNNNILHAGKTTIIGLTLSKGMRVDKERSIDFINDYLPDDVEGANQLDLIGKALVAMIACHEREVSMCELLYQKEYRTGQQMYFLVFKIIL